MYYPSLAFIAACMFAQKCSMRQTHRTEVSEQRSRSPSWRAGEENKAIPICYKRRRAFEVVFDAACSISGRRALIIGSAQEQ